jgi:hypothetical protein
MTEPMLYGFVAWVIMMTVLVFLYVQIKKQRLATNSRLDTLLSVSSKLAHLEGFEEGRRNAKRLQELTEKPSGANKNDTPDPG